MLLQTERDGIRNKVQGKRHCNNLIVNTRTSGITTSAAGNENHPVTKQFGVCADAIREISSLTGRSPIGQVARDDCRPRNNPTAIDQLCQLSRSRVIFLTGDRMPSPIRSGGTFESRGEKRCTVDTLHARKATVQTDRKTIANLRQRHNQKRAFKSHAYS